MKTHISTLFLLLIITLSCKAQIIPIEQHLTYLEAYEVEEADEVPFPQGIYFKDVNNLFDAYIGSWVGTYNGNTIELEITERTDDDGFGTIIDELLLRYRVTNGGVEIANTLNLPDNDPKVNKGMYFDHNGIYQMHYIYSIDCGQVGTLYIKVRPNPNEMTFSLYPKRERDNSPDCTNPNQILPTSYIVLTKL